MTDNPADVFWVTRQNTPLKKLRDKRRVIGRSSGTTYRAVISERQEHQVPERLAHLFYTLEHYGQELMRRSAATFSFIDEIGVSHPLLDSPLLSQYRSQFLPASVDVRSNRSEVELYKSALKKTRSDQRERDDRLSKQRQQATAALDLALPLADPVGFQLLGLLHFFGPLSLTEALEEFDNTTSTFECIARLHLVGALRFQDGKLLPTSLGTKILNDFELLEEERTD